MRAHALVHDAETHLRALGQRAVRHEEPAAEDLLRHDQVSNGAVRLGNILVEVWNAELCEFGVGSDAKLDNDVDLLVSEPLTASGLDGGPVETTKPFNLASLGGEEQISATLIA